jgi:tetratricopeptide (TPR) repeat protein
MATTKRVRRNIKEDQLVTWAVRFSQWSQEHFNQVIIGVVALLAVIAFVVYTTNSRQSSNTQAERQLSSALNLFQTGDYEAARTSFQQIHERFGGRQGAAAMYFEAEAEFRQGNYAEAEQSYDAYIQQASDAPEFTASAVFGKALALEGQDRFREAAEAMSGLLETLDETDPRYIDAAYRSGELFAQAGDSERAVTHFQLVVDKAQGPLQAQARANVSLLGG